jgi:hypothetical protein
VLTGKAIPFPIPLIKPDVRISRIRPPVACRLQYGTGGKSGSVYGVAARGLRKPRSLVPANPVLFTLQARNASPTCFVYLKDMIFRLFAAGILITASAFAQATDTKDSNSKEHNKGSKHDVSSGVGDIGKGAGRGALSAAKGTGKAAGDLVTLHPVNAATDLGKGAVGAGKNVGVGAVKGTGKIIKGTGKAIKHLF